MTTTKLLQVVDIDPRTHGGVQRIVNLIQKELGGDVKFCTGNFAKKVLYWNWLGITGQLRRYDSIITHGGPSLNVARYHPKVIWYCHSPQRWLYDLYEEEQSKRQGSAKLFFSLACSILRRLDQWNVRHVHSILANSNYTRERVMRYYGREAKTVYPPVSLWPSAEENRRERKLAFAFQRVSDTEQQDFISGGALSDIYYALRLII